MPENRDGVRWMYVTPFTIEDVADLLSIKKLKNASGNFPVVCPYCGDARGKMNFCICKDGEIRNTFHCYNCGAGGNMLQLYADLRGLVGVDRCKKAYWSIMDELSIHKKTNTMIPGGNQTRMLHTEGQSAASDQQRDETYRAMLSYLHLNQKHKNDLIRRGLSESMISHMEELGYRSTDESEAKRIARCLIRDGYRLTGVPGFFVDRNGDWTVAFYSYNRGYLCPVYNTREQLIGFQIRLEQPYKGMKYSWFTSSGKKNGCSSKSPAGYYGKSQDKIVYVTEGILKAAIANEATGRSFIGNPGVGHYKELKVMLSELKQRGLNIVIEAYDMDKLMKVTCGMDCGIDCNKCNMIGSRVCQKKERKRDDIRTGCRHLYRICDELSLKCIRMVWDTDGAGEWNGEIKGIDDWLVCDQIRYAAAA